jgi:hypothetical protein
MIFVVAYRSGEYSIMLDNGKSITGSVDVPDDILLQEWKWRLRIGTRVINERLWRIGA